MKNYFFPFLIAMFLSAGAIAQSGVKVEHVVQDVQATKVVASRGGAPGLTAVPVSDSAIAYAECSCGCNVTFDNYTGYWINVYVDSLFKGIIEPYGSGELWILPESATWYAETAGSTYYWLGNLGCANGDQYIKLWE